MRTMIFCEVTDKGIHSFYLKRGREKYFLFCQNYRKGVHEYYSGGVTIDESMNYAKSHNDCAIRRTMTKIPKYIKYAEKEFGVEVMRRTKQREGNGYNEMKKSA